MYIDVFLKGFAPSFLRRRHDVGTYLVGVRDTRPLLRRSSLGSDRDDLHSDCVHS